MKDRIKIIILIILIFTCGWISGVIHTIDNSYVLEYGNDYVAICYGNTDVYYSIDF